MDTDHLPRPKGFTAVLPPESARYRELYQDFYERDTTPPASPPVIVQCDYRYPRMRWYLLASLLVLLRPEDFYLGWNAVYNATLCVCAVWWFRLLSINCTWFAFDDTQLRIRGINLFGSKYDIATIRKAAITAVELKSSLMGATLTLKCDESATLNGGDIKDMRILRDSSNDQDLKWFEMFITEWREVGKRTDDA